jgi:hypothetical protein
VLEQIFYTRPLVRIFHKAMLQEIIELLGPPVRMVKTWRIRLLDL